MNVVEIIANLRSEIAEAQAALRYFERNGAKYGIYPGMAHDEGPIHQRSCVLPSQQVIERVLALLRSDPNREWPTAEIIAEVQANQTYVVILLTRLMKEGKVVRIRRGRYKIAPKAQPESNAA